MGDIFYIFLVMKLMFSVLRIIFILIDIIHSNPIFICSEEQDLRVEGEYSGI